MQPVTYCHMRSSVQKVVEPNFLTHGPPSLKLLCCYTEVIYVYNLTEFYLGGGETY